MVRCPTVERQSYFEFDEAPAWESEGERMTALRLWELAHQYATVNLMRQSNVSNQITTVKRVGYISSLFSSVLYLILL